MSPGQNDDDFSPPRSSAHPLRLWYTSRGTLWNDSMPIGNGRLGGMIRGVPTQEIISTNEDSFWSGTAMDRLNPDAASTLKTVQQLLVQGEAPKAELEAALGLSGTPTSMRIYQPGGDLWIKYDGVNTSDIGGYERWLDLSDGTAGVYFEAGGVAYKREYIASVPASVLAVRLTASEPGKLSVRVKFERPSDGQNRFVDKSYAEDGHSIFSLYSSGDIRAVTGARVRYLGGTSRQIGDNVQVMGADEVWVYSDTETTVRCQDPLGEAKTKLAAAAARTYQEIRDEHVKDYQELFGRTEFSLGESTDEQRSMPTDKRRQTLGQGAFDPEFVSLYFQFGRYLLISSSRPGTFPANLQGIWNNELSPGWGSKFTININLEMNYWPSQVTDLQELNQPLFDLIEKIYTSGKRTATEMYSARGWLAHHNTDIWGDTAPQDIWAPGAYWPLGGVWLVSHIYEHYLYTRDAAFLEKYYYLFYEAAEFFEDFLTDYKGWKVTNPSTSPENSYKNGSITGSMTVGSTMDNTLLRELFDNLFAATAVLGKPETQLIRNVKTLRDKLPPLAVSSRTGRLMEWIEDFNETEPGHRHMSHLYGLFPGSEIKRGDKKTWDAAVAALAWRVSNDAGDMGWSRAWTTALHARVLDGKSVQADIAALLVNLTHNSLLDAGPPAAFQIDGNFGGTAAIAESLLQSHEYDDQDGGDGQRVLIRVLPALMPSSVKGRFGGLVARGGFVVSAEWDGGKVTKVVIQSRIGGKVSVTAADTGVKLASEGRDSEAGEVLVLDTVAGGAYTLVGVSK
ncbi:alpha-L-fucosidase 2 [Microdochium trichocladiopsis]|uniref:Alpha-L-fucosidase 2 n=1 Tax=Microdochium trichocladiopsis TaxID=1682393 RepID=A0A9P9BMP5_9PEZI|nr:alpha-L-fucosidase 2 [Microdochium trichocladiopsis]KAH7029828.1 alpha-L-fucosidase 2 [Microdochium trichocladiopsis]